MNVLKKGIIFVGIVTASLDLAVRHVSQRSHTVAVLRRKKIPV